MLYRKNIPKIQSIKVRLKHTKAQGRTRSRVPAGSIHIRIAKQKTPLGETSFRLFNQYPEIFAKKEIPDTFDFVFDTMLQFANVFSYFKITALEFKDFTIFIKDRVAQMNNIRSRATEIINHDIIYN